MRRRKPTPQHKLAVIGDSLSQGFQNGGIYRTDLSFPAFLYQCWDQEPSFDQARFTAQAGIPLNLEVLTRGLAEELGEDLEWSEYPRAVAHLYRTLRRVKAYWENRHQNLQAPRHMPYHNQSVWGFAMNDTWMLDEEYSSRHRANKADTFSILDLLPDHAMYITAGLVLNPSFSERFQTHSQLDNIQYLQEHGGIENLVVSAGPNNIVGAVSDLRFVLSEPHDLTAYPTDRTYTVYRPEHFEQEFRKLAEQVSRIGAQRVITQTIPYVTIPPVTRGVNSDKTRKRHRGYFDYYTRFWIWDSDFNPDFHPHLTKEEAITLDQHVDYYNAIIREVAEEYGWITVPLNRYVTSMARRRLGGRMRSRYPKAFTKALDQHPMTAHLIEDPDNPRLSTDFIRIDEDTKKVTKGGLFSLDGIHPTTIGYGLIAHLYKRTMEDHGVSFDRPLDWDFIIRNDTLVTDPPFLLVQLRSLLRFLSLGRGEQWSMVREDLLDQMLSFFSPIRQNGG